MTDDKNLYYLDELPDYKIAFDYCDVRGWEVKDAYNRTIGTVDNLMVNKNEERVVYLDVAVDNDLIEEGHKMYAGPAGSGVQEFLNKDGDDHLIIPIGMVRLDEDNKTLLAGEINYTAFAKTNRFTKGTAINRNYEITLIRNYNSSYMVDDSFIVRDNFYAGKEFENTLIRGDV